MEVKFWQGFFKALNCEFKPIEKIQGASGIIHRILCLGLDEAKKRIVIVQDEQDARILTMVQADLQAKIKGYNVLMVRPVTVNLSMAFGAIALALGSYKLTRDDIKGLSNNEGDSQKLIEENKERFADLIKVVSPQIEIIQKTKLSAVPIIKEVVQQLSHIKILQNLESDDVLDFGELMTFNPVIYDTALGICPIPLYEFTVDETESFINYKELDQNIAILQKHSIHQFFYPPADSLALGFIESEKYTPQELIKNLSKVPDLGHPFGKNELTEVDKFNELIDALKDKGLVVEGEFSIIDITEKGIEKRMEVKYKPRESIFKRLSNVFSIKVEINFKDIFGTGGSS